MANKRHEYSKESDILWFSVDETELGGKINFVAAVKNFVYFDMNPSSGAIRSLEIKHITKLMTGEKSSPFIEYSEEDGCLQINLNMDGYEKIGADLIFADMDNYAMATLDRNEVGNLQGVEIVNLNYFLS